MPRRMLLLVALAAVVFVVPSWTAPVPVRPRGKPGPKEIINGIGMKLMRIEAGNFMMGSPRAEKDRRRDEHLHEVEITDSFYMGIYAVTQKEFSGLMGYNPSCFSADGVGKPGLKYEWGNPASGKGKVAGKDTSSFPVENVSWQEATEFCDRLTKRERRGRVYRLPTEAQWEYACRAGTKTRYFTGNGAADLGRAGWYNANSGCRTHASGEKTANAFGLFDMHGNVSQLCSDWYGEGAYTEGVRRNPTGPANGRFRVIRGGNWSGSATNCRAAMRNHRRPDEQDVTVGFRVVCVPSGR